MWRTGEMGSTALGRTGVMLGCRNQEWNNACGVALGVKTNTLDTLDFHDFIISKAMNHSLS